MPNRNIKESITTSETINALSNAEEAFFCRLWVVCDDYGLMDARPAILKGRMYPLRDIPLEEISQRLEALCAVGLVRVYEVGDKPYLWVVNWHEHQQTRADASKYPLPPGYVIRCKRLIADDSTCKQMIADDSRFPRIPNTDNDNDIPPQTIGGGVDLQLSADELTHDSPEYPPDFVAFWNEYPRKQYKTDAFRSWKSLLNLPANKRPPAVLLIGAARRYADDCELKGTPPDKIMHGATFLSPKSRRFEDWLTDSPTAQSPAVDLPRGMSLPNMRECKVVY